MMEFIEEHNTNILPLRWFANLCEKPAHYNLMIINYLDWISINNIEWE
jgi:hypothetical protein